MTPQSKTADWVKKKATIEPENWRDEIETLLGQSNDERILIRGRQILKSEKTERAFRLFLYNLGHKSSPMVWSEVELLAFTLAILQCVKCSIQPDIQPDIQPEGVGMSGFAMKLVREYQKDTKPKIDVLERLHVDLPVIFHGHEELNHANEILNQMKAYYNNYQAFGFKTGRPSGTKVDECFIQLYSQFRKQLGNPVYKAIAYLMTATFGRKYTYKTLKTKRDKLKKVGKIPH